MAGTERTPSHTPALHTSHGLRQAKHSGARAKFLRTGGRWGGMGQALLHAQHEASEGMLTVLHLRAAEKWTKNRLYCTFRSQEPGRCPVEPPDLQHPARHC